MSAGIDHKRATSISKPVEPEETDPFFNMPMDSDTASTDPMKDGNNVVEFGYMRREFPLFSR